jgi:hypothetical protein
LLRNPVHALEGKAAGCTSGLKPYMRQRETS